MTKFEDLCKAYSEARQKYFRYRDDCFRFSGRFVNELLTYLGLPKENIQFFVPSKGWEPKVMYSLLGAMELSSEDTYWHLGVAFNLYEAPNVYPHQPILIQILIKKDGDRFLVKAGPNGSEFSIQENQGNDYQSFNDWLFSLIKGNFEQGLEKFLEKGAEAKKIGF